MKVWTITLCFTDPDIIHDSLAQYRATASPQVETVHVLVNQHWPIGKETNAAELEKIARKFGCLLLDPGRNLGLHDGFNWAWRKQNIPDNAMVIGYDPDSWPVTPGWDQAMCDVFVSDPSVAWLSLWHIHAEREVIEDRRGGAIEVLGGHRVVPLKRPAINSICGFRQGWLRQVGGLWEGNAFYGGLEVGMWEKLGQNRWVFLRDFREANELYDRMNPLYKEYKWKHAQTREWPGDFESFLKSKGLT